MATASWQKGIDTGQTGSQTTRHANCHWMAFVGVDTPVRCSSAGAGGGVGASKELDPLSCEGIDDHCGEI